MQNINVKQANIIRLIFISMVLVCFFACKKEKEKSGCNIGSAYQNYPLVFPPGRRYGYNAASFNPNNPNEFACLRGDDSANTAAIISYNIQSGQTNVIYTTSTIWYGPRWGKNNWIVFGIDNDVYKIKATGDSLTQITVNGSTFFPDWNYDGTKLIYALGTVPVNTTVITDDQGNFLDSMTDEGYELIDWSINNGYILVGFNSPVQIRLINDTTLAERIINHTNPLSSLCWLDNDDFLFIDHDGISRYNVKTQQVQLFKPPCDANGVYQAVTVSPDGQKILAETSISNVNTTNKTIEIYNAMYLMNTDGSDVTLINLPAN